MTHLRLEMALTCATCGKKFNKINEVTDHISDTYKGWQGETFAGSYSPEELSNQKELKQFTDATRGFAHLYYRDKNGTLLSNNADVILYTSMMAGAKWCTDCRAEFPNNYQLYKHCIDINHAKPMIDFMKSEMQRFNEFQNHWF